MRADLVQEYVELRKEYYLVSNGTIDIPAQAGSKLTMKEYCLQAEERLDMLKVRMSIEEQKLCNEKFLDWVKHYVFG